MDFIVFFSDPLTAQPHDPDVKALLRIAQVYDIPIANNKATADFLITSSYMNSEYEHRIINFQETSQSERKACKFHRRPFSMTSKEPLPNFFRRGLQFLYLPQLICQLCYV